MFKPTKPLPFVEFVTLVGLMVSIVAMSIDIMLPALGDIGRDLAVEDPNDVQLVVSSMFAGFAVGQMFAGPISDTIGRKRAIYIGYVIFLFGCVMSLFADGMETMLAGRFLQGLGAASPRIVTVAMVRDSYAGRAMARVMSIAMAVFIIVPTVAPSIGQVTIMLAGWHATFLLLMAMAAVCWVWLAARQPESLKPEDHRPFSFSSLATGLIQVLRFPAALGYMLAAGCLFAAFLGYLSTAQQIFQDAYGVGEYFAIYFGIAALAIGIASLVNSKVVMRLGMRYLAFRAFIVKSMLAIGFLMVLIAYDGLPPLWVFMPWLLAVFFCVGLLFGNLNALAMEPLGHLAGIGAAVIGSGSTLIGLPVGWALARAFDGTLYPLVLGFAVMSVLALIIMRWTEMRVVRAETASA